MATRKTTSRRSSSTPTAPQTIGPAAVKELVEQVVRQAIRTQARDLEKHFTNIHERLVALEKK